MGRELAPLELARLCQRAESEFRGHALRHHGPVRFRFRRVSAPRWRSIAAAWSTATSELPEGVTFVAVNTMVKHALAGSAYKERVRECAAAASAKS